MTAVPDLLAALAPRHVVPHHLVAAEGAFEVPVEGSGLLLHKLGELLGHVVKEVAGGGGNCAAVATDVVVFCVEAVIFLLTDLKQ